GRGVGEEGGGVGGGYRAVRKAQPLLGAAMNHAAADASAFEDKAIADKAVAGRVQALAARPAVGPLGDGAFAFVAPAGFGERTPPFGNLAPNTGSGKSPSTNYSGWLRVTRAFCVPQNPALRQLRLRAQLNLYKL